MSEQSTETGDKTLELTFFHDPGHGWLEVPRAMLVELGIAGVITSFSYQHEDRVYLEEDLDAARFTGAAKRAGYRVEVTSQYQENTPIRGYESYLGRK